MIEDIKTAWFDEIRICLSMLRPFLAMNYFLLCVFSLRSTENPISFLDAFSRPRISIRGFVRPWVRNPITKNAITAEIQVNSTKFAFGRIVVRTELVRLKFSRVQSYNQ